ncbi:hypothetical protein DRP77_08380 [Candidatus Poribacteria bacterium]|nr:MAG: hypothetical protein DRP77_08380 [Candidatus Poribacteria bacterium]
MDIDAIPDGTLVFVDANIFIYHFAGVSDKCTRFLQRVLKGEVKAVVSTIVMAELIHRRMVAEAVEKGFVTLRNAVRKLKENPRIVKLLSQYSRDVEAILALPIIVEPITRDDIISSGQLRERYGLMTNDSLNLACMERLGIRDIATRDEDFEAVEWINVWKPDDI